MTRERLKTYLPNNTKAIYYNQIVCWNNSNYGECSKHFKAETIEELKAAIENWLKDSALYGTVSNVEYGKIYTCTEIKEYKEVNA
jgi:hypothetical protein